MTILSKIFFDLLPTNNYFRTKGVHIGNGRGIRIHTHIHIQILFWTRASHDANMSGERADIFSRRLYPELTMMLINGWWQLFDVFTISTHSFTCLSSSAQRNLSFRARIASTISTTTPTTTQKTHFILYYYPSLKCIFCWMKIFLRYK